MSWWQTIAAVVAGGAISTGGQAALEARHEKRAQKAEERATDAARRQVVGELWGVYVALKELERGALAPETIMHLVKARQRWNEHSAALAHDNRFLVIDGAYSLAGYVATAWDTLALDPEGRAQQASVARRQANSALDLLDPGRALRDNLVEPPLDDPT